MITMDRALEQNRDTFAVPGPANAPMSAGTNMLIRQGWAKLVTDASDVLIEYEGRRPLKRVRAMEQEAMEQRLETALQEPARSAPAEKKEVDKKENRAYIDWKSARELFTDDERGILSALEEKSMQVDEIIEATQIPARRVLSTLTVLQLRGYVDEGAGKRFSSLVRLQKEEK